MLEDLAAREPGDDAGHAPGDGPAAPRRLPAQRRAAVHAAGDRPARAADPRRSAGRSCDDAAERGDVDFVHDVCAKLPSQVVGELMGIPEEDWPQIHRWPRVNTGGQDPDFSAGYSDDAAIERDRSRWRCTRSSSRGKRRAEPRRGPHHADARDGARRRADDRHPVRQLLRAARHRGQRHHADDAVVGPARAARSTPTSSPSCAPTRRSSPARSRRSCAGRTRCTTSGAPRPPTPSSAGVDDRRRATRSR